MINLHCSLLTGHSPALLLWTYSSTVVWSSASVFASFSFRRLHSSILRSSSCCSSFKPDAVLLLAWFFWWWNTQILTFQCRYIHFVFYIFCIGLSAFGLNWSTNSFKIWSIYIFCLLAESVLNIAKGEPQQYGYVAYKMHMLLKWTEHGFTPR